jgi:ATP-dependent exoDNAse (exonuclease V) beta subunit
MSSPNKPAPPDQSQRDLALDPTRSILVQAPAGSGKTTLLADRFLRLLSEVDEPGQVVAITFTNAAAAEMRNRILEKLRAPEPEPLALRALRHSQALGWNLLELPAQLRIRTIDSFCRELALQRPLLSSLGGGLDIAEQPDDLCRRAARRSLERIDDANSLLSGAIASLLKWRDNNWKDVEDLLVLMLGKRERWMQEFVLARDPDLHNLRAILEKPFANALREALVALDEMLGHAPGAREEILSLARFACEEPGEKSPWDLAECAEIPSAPFSGDLNNFREIFVTLGGFLQTQKGAWRSEKGLKTSDGFPSTPRGKAGKARFSSLIAKLASVSGLESALAAVPSLPPARYTDEDWQIVQACFILLRHAVGQLQVVFAESGKVDYTEVAQIARRVLKGEDGLPTDAAMGVADGIRHLLVDEFQDTSRRQHQLLASLIAAWSEPAGRTCFVVGDPMQSIYFFREADAELFPRVKSFGLDLPNAEPFLFGCASLSANFRTAPPLVHRLNEVFAQVFAAGDGSGITFNQAEPARIDLPSRSPEFNLHLGFQQQTARGKSPDPEIAKEKEASHAAQLEEIVNLIQSHSARIGEAKTHDGKFRIAVLARARKSLLPIAQALHKASIPFRAVELEQLKDRPEVLDALSLVRALLNPQDRVAWLGVLRAPWCALALDDLHRLASADDPQLLARPVPDLLAERLPLLSQEGQHAASRVLDVWNSYPALRAAQPTASIGTWLEQIWLRLGASACVDASARANIDLLWSCLDGLPAGEQDLPGPALNAALGKLTALPDPEANSDAGVQLMTIHKSKGLEFEVVIVPDLQAATKSGKREMLSWLERGLAQPDDEGNITEFLIAPFQPRSKDPGETKKWVDRIYHERELQENRRILYVAATRAREELHLFARPACKTESDRQLSLADPAKNSLLATAWPALAEEIRTRFNEWKSAKEKSAASEEQVIESIAASESNLLVMPTPAKPTLLRRLPPDYNHQPSEDTEQVATLRAPSFRLFSGERVGNHESPGAPEPVLSLPKDLASETWKEKLYSRHEGSMISRAFGTAVHSLLEELARLRSTHEWEPARTALKSFEPRIAAQVRASGVGQAQAASIAAQALESALSASKDPIGQWLLSPHTDAASETSWAAVIAGNLNTVRVDRLFRAGPTPGSEGENCWWIIDYKTAHTDNIDPAAALPELRKIFAPQLETYAAVLRNLHGIDASIRAGLYYPRMIALDWWQL